MSLQKLKDERVIGVRLSPDKKEVLIHDACCIKFQCIFNKDEFNELLADLDEIWYEMEMKDFLKED